MAKKKVKKKKQAKKQLKRQMMITGVAINMLVADVVDGVIQQERGTNIVRIPRNKWLELHKTLKNIVESFRKQGIDVVRPARFEKE